MPLNYRIEKRYCRRFGKVIAGIDEVGRGPIAGPLVVAVVVMDSAKDKFFKDKRWKKIKDSKKLTPLQREKLAKFIKKNLAWGTAMVSSRTLDRIGVVRATEKAVVMVLKKINITPSLILIDGRHTFKAVKIPQQAVVKGDNRLFSIAAASIVAKTTRDEWMRKAAGKWPGYFFEKHKGYGTRLHLKMLKKLGASPLHRFSFAPVSRRGRRKSSYPKRQQKKDD